MPGNNFKKIETVRLDGGNFNINSLDNFTLNQRVTECWRRAGNAYRLLPVSYTENWNLFERREKAQKIITALNSGATAFAAVKDSVIIGFALLANQPFGSNKQYLELSEFYVSDKFRRRGTGKLLFEKICCEAKKAGAAKLYISAHSARESIAAYIKYGCKFAKEPDKEHIAGEPYDLQLEYDLSTRIYEVSDKYKYIELLLLADEQKEMVERYLHNSVMYVIDDCGVKGEITVSDAGNGVLEIKNLAVIPQHQRCGYGKKLVDFICEKYKGQFSVIQAGTGESPLTIPFYKKCGFTPSHTVKDFFTKNYDRPIFETGKQLIDMVYLTKNL